MNERIVLHQFPQSHYCIRIRWAMGFKGISFEVQNHTRKTLNTVRELTNGWGFVPVLVTGKRVVSDSPMIARFLEDISPTPTLYPPGTTPEICDMVNTWVDVKVMMTAAKFLLGEYLEFLGDEDERTMYIDNFVKPVHKMTVEEIVSRKSEFEKDLGQHWNLLNESLKGGSYLFGNTLSYSDLAIASRLKLMDIVGNYSIPENYSHILKWYSKISKIGD